MKMFPRLFFITFLFSNCIHTQSLNEKNLLWQQMQELYGECINDNSDDELLEWCHPQWDSARAKLQEIIERKHYIDFFHEPCISGTMIRTGYELPQFFEETYLKFCLSPSTKNILGQASDTDFGNLPHSSKSFNCSTNTLGHLYYLAKIIEHSLKIDGTPQIETLVEIGGGYGNLARLIKQVLPNTTVIIIDLPEMCALQWFFLKNSCVDPQIIFHTQFSASIVTKAINIIPLNILKNVVIKADTFISTFALSECTVSFQNYIINKSFFNASLCYVSGQLNGWGEHFNFVKHPNLINNIYSMYSDVTCNPFHIFSTDLQSYEIIARQHKG